MTSTNEEIQRPFSLSFSTLKSTRLIVSPPRRFVNEQSESMRKYFLQRFCVRPTSAISHARLPDARYCTMHVPGLSCSSRW